MERYIIARLLAIGFVLFMVIFLIIRIATSGREPSTDEPIEEPIALSELHTTTNSSVQFIIEGKTEALDNHEIVRFTVSKTRRTLEYVVGYNGKVKNSVSLSNTEEAYQDFLEALEFNGFDLPRSDKKATVLDPRGACSLGRIYTYKVRIGATTRDELWSASCSSKYGNFGGSRSTIEQLFELQFPQFDTFNDNIDMI